MPAISSRNTVPPTDSPMVFGNATISASINICVQSMRVKGLVARLPAA